VPGRVSPAPLEGESRRQQARQRGAAQGPEPAGGAALRHEVRRLQVRTFFWLSNVSRTVSLFTRCSSSSCRFQSVDCCRAVSQRIGQPSISFIA
jgi:hypothetical protein